MCSAHVYKSHKGLGNHEFQLFQSLPTATLIGIRIPRISPLQPCFNRVRDQTPQLVELLRSAQFPGHSLRPLSQRRCRARGAGRGGELCCDVLELAIHLAGQ